LLQSSEDANSGIALTLSHGMTPVLMRMTQMLNNILPSVFDMASAVKLISLNQPPGINGRAIKEMLKAPLDWPLHVSLALDAIWTWTKRPTAISSPRNDPKHETSIIRLAVCEHSASRHYPEGTWFRLRSRHQKALAV
jgi:hypothetical protein